MRRLALALVAPVAIGALALTGCTAGGSSSSGDSDDTLTLAATADLYGWKPVDQPGYQNWGGEAVWARLMNCNSVFELEADIADEWEVLDGNTGVTAHIRDGATFEDGTPITSADIQASFEYAGSTGGSQADYEGMTFDTPDDQTITLGWDTPQVNLNSKVCNVLINSGDWLDAGDFDAPFSSGPYTLDAASTTTGSVYTFDKRDDYWDADRYPFSTLVVKIIDSDAAVVSALKTGQVDGSLVSQTSGSEVEASGLEIQKFMGNTTRLIISDHLGTVEPALGDVRVRQAMNMVFDKEAMAETLYLGEAMPTPQVFREGSQAYIEGLEDPYPFDVEKATQLMADAGYADGFSLEFPTMEGQNFETLLPYVTQQLALINITVTEAPLSGANAISDLLSGKYPVVLWQLGNLGSSAQQIYIESTPDGWWDLQHQPDEYVDSRYAELGAADEATSVELQQEINQYIVEQAWFAPMVYSGTSYAYNADKVSFPTQSDPEALTPKLRDFGAAN